MQTQTQTQGRLKRHRVLVKGSKRPGPSCGYLPSACRRGLWNVGGSEANWTMISEKRDVKKRRTRPP